MAALTSQFTDALSRIEPSAQDKANAPVAHQQVRDALASADELKDWGLDPVLIGSYKRDVSIRRVKDVDVFSRMNDIGDDVSATTVLDRFRSVLDAEFGLDQDGNKRVKRQARSVTVDFPEFNGLHVDAVPARKLWNGYWEIPTSDGSWQQTNPEELTALKTAMNESFDGNYVRLVKLIRQTRRSILGATRPGGLFAELCLYDACKNGKVSKEGLTIGYITGLEAIADYLDQKVAWGQALPDPTMPGQTLSFRATDKQWETARDKFRAAAEKVRAAYNEDDPGLAAVAFRELLGKNGDDEWVFQMPPGYDEDGSQKASATLITPGARTVPAGTNPRFG